MLNGVQFLEGKTMAAIQTLQTWSGGAGETRNVVVSGSGTAQLQASDGAGGWVDVPDGLLTAPTVTDVYCAAGAVFRFVIVTAVVSISQ
jgi:hypothetical protein